MRNSNGRPAERPYCRSYKSGQIQITLRIEHKTDQIHLMEYNAVYSVESHPDISEEYMSILSVEV
jgi:hypothetical protein